MYIGYVPFNTRNVRGVILSLFNVEIEIEWRCDRYEREVELDHHKLQLWEKYFKAQRYILFGNGRKLRENKITM